MILHNICILIYLYYRSLSSEKNEDYLEQFTGKDVDINLLH